MLSSTDHDKLQQIIQEHPETEELFNRIFKSHQMDISTISHEIRNPLTLVYSTLQLIESQHPEVLEFAHWSELHQDIEYMKLLLEDLSSYNNGERLDLAPLSTGSFFRRIALSFASSSPISFKFTGASVILFMIVRLLNSLICWNTIPIC